MTSNKTTEQNSLSQNKPKGQDVPKSILSELEHPKTDTSVPKILMDFVKQEKLRKVKDLDEKVKSMMFLGKNKIPMGGKMKSASVCKVCGKEAGHSAIRDHIEANHLEGISIPCNICKKDLKSRKTLRKHNIIFHKYAK